MKYIIIIALLFCANVVFSQEEERDFLRIETDTASAEIQDIQMLFKYTEAGLKVRWAPTNATAWLQGNEYGYKIERLEPDSLRQNEVEDVGSGSFKPWPLAQWESIVSDEKPYAAAAAMAIHGESNSETSGFVQEAQDLQNRFGFALLAADLDWDAAIASGLGHIDTDVHEGSLYFYRITLNGPAETPFDTVASYTITSFDHFPPVEMLELVPGEKSLTVSWTNSQKMPYSAFHVERSVDNVNFDRITEQPFIDVRTNLDGGGESITFVDSLDINYLKYYYRAIGLDAFGEEGLPSLVVEGMAIDKTLPTAPASLVATEINKGEMTLSWEWQAAAVDHDFVGFNVYKSLDFDEAFVKLNENILPADTRTYIDPNPDPRETNYYYITGVDEEGNEAKSVIGFGITKDEVPPAPPTNLQSAVDSNGLLLLQWDAPADKDIRGYQVLYSNSRNAEFGARSRDYLPSSHFVDSISLKTLTKNIYYYVIAIDYSYNQSEASEILEVKRPDIVAPEASIITDYEVTDEGIRFQWIRSTSNDVEKVELLRKIGDKRWVTVNDFDENNAEYLDTDVEGGVLYSYQLKTIDQDGNESLAEKPLGLEALTPFYITSVENARAEEVDNVWRLTWQYEEVPYIEFIVYKGISEDALSTYKRIQNQYNLEVPKTEITSSQSFWIKAKGKDGRESKLVPITPH